MAVLGLLVVFLIIDISRAVSVASVSCPGIKLVKLGCYKDDQMKPRPLPQMLITDRDKTSPVFSGVKINWKNWNLYMTDLICRCAQKSVSKGFNKMGLQHYGECWSGENSKTLSYARSGKTPFCITWRGKKCSDGLDCIGEDHANFVYAVEKDMKPTAAPTAQPTNPVTTPVTVNTTPATTPKPTTPKATTPKPTTPKQTTPKTSPKPTTSSGTSTAPPPTRPAQPTQSPPNPCIPSSPAGCQQPVQTCAYPPCMQPVVQQPMPVIPQYPSMIGCGKSKIPCKEKNKAAKKLQIPSLDDDDNDDDDIVH